MLGKDALVRMHAGALNGHDPETILGHCHAGVRCIKDGCLVGEGVDVVRKALLDEFAVNADLVGRVMELDGEPVVAEWGGAEGREVPHGVVRLEAHGDRVTEVHFDHDAKTVRRLAVRPFT